MPCTYVPDGQSGPSQTILPVLLMAPKASSGRRVSNCPEVLSALCIALPRSEVFRVLLQFP